MINVLVRTLILYLATFCFFRLMGKRQVGDMQPFELIITLLAADLVASPMQDQGVSLMEGVVPIATLFALHNIFAYAALKSEKIRIVVSGRPSVLIENGIVNKKELKKLNMNLNDLIENLRVKGTPELQNICFATLETNGELSVLLNNDAQPPTAKDMKIDVTQVGMPLAVVLDGKMNAGNMNKIGLQPKKLHKELKAAGFADEKEVFIAMLDAQHDLYIQGDGDAPKVVSRNIGKLS